MSTPADDALFSVLALRRAWQQVRRNGPSPGIDGVSLAQFAANLESELMDLHQDIISNSYRPQAALRFYVAKPSGKNRVLTVWSVRDRVAQRTAHEYMTPILEQMFLPCSYGFRPGRSTQDAIKAVVHAYDTHRRWVVDTDIADCFDSIPTHLLMQHVRRVIPSKRVVQLITQWLETPIHGQLGETAGVSQGSVISPLLANLHLHRFDQMIFAALPGIFLVRFADDLVMCFRERQQAEWGLEVAERTLANLGLTLNRDKTTIVHFQEGFEFLGVAFKGRRYRPLKGE